MSSITQVAEAMQRVLTMRAKELERATGFVQRSTAQLDGPTFAQTTVFGWMDSPEASYGQLRHVAASVEVAVSSQALVLARCRWQIELLWKLWKQVGKVDTWRSAKPWRIATEISAKLLGLLITHWVTLIECRQAPNRSVVKAGQVMRWMASALALGVAGVVPLEAMVQRTSQAMASGCTVNARHKKPATYQLVANPKLNSS